MTAMVRAENLTKRYRDRTVLDRLDFEVERGERVALLERDVQGHSASISYSGILRLTRRNTLNGPSRR